MNEKIEISNIDIEHLREDLVADSFGIAVGMGFPEHKGVRHRVVWKESIQLAVLLFKEIVVTFT